MIYFYHIRNNWEIISVNNKIFWVYGFRAVLLNFLFFILNDMFYMIGKFSGKFNLKKLYKNQQIQIARF